jgi:hypothetical protein
MIDKNGFIVHEEFGKIYTSSEMETILGWKRVLKNVKILFGKTEVFERVRGQPSQLKKSVAYIYRIYDVYADKPICRWCSEYLQNEKINGPACRLRIMPSGVVKRSFLSIFGTFGKSDFTETFSDYDSKAYKLKSEKTVSISEILDLYSKGEIHIINDLEIRHLCEKTFNIII